VSSWKRFSYSASLAIILSALSVVFYHLGGEFIANPGMILEGWANLLVLLLTNDPYGGFSNRWMYFNIPIYTVVIYSVSLAVSAMKNERKTNEPQDSHPRSSDIEDLSQ
jgi:hypothetical protein